MIFDKSRSLYINLNVQMCLRTEPYNKSYIKYSLSAFQDKFGQILAELLCLRCRVAEIYLGVCTSGLSFISPVITFMSPPSPPHNPLPHTHRFPFCHRLAVKSENTWALIPAKVFYSLFLFHPEIGPGASLNGDVYINNSWFDLFSFDLFQVPEASTCSI